MAATRINVAEPHIDSLPGRLERQDNVRLVALEEAVSRSSLVVVLVDHDAVRALPPEVLAGKLLVDTRGVFSS